MADHPGDPLMFQLIINTIVRTIVAQLTREQMRKFRGK
jgi:hypothetical protein